MLIINGCYKAEHAKTVSTVSMHQMARETINGFSVWFSVSVSSFFLSLLTFRPNKVSVRSAARQVEFQINNKPDLIVSVEAVVCTV